MGADETEAALVALLSRLSEADDPSVADQAIDRYLDRFAETERLAAFGRLTRALLAAEDDEEEATGSLRVALRRRFR